MAADANPTAGDPSRRRGDDRTDDEARFADISTALGDAVQSVLPGWIERLVVERVHGWRGDVTPEVARAAVKAGEAAVDDVMPRLRGLLASDIDLQRENPLSILRGATRHAHDVLADLRMPPISRDEFARGSFPDDVYGLVPASWDDVDPSLHEIGITWGAAKAYIHKARRRDEGRV